MNGSYATTRISNASARDRKSTRLNSSHGYISYAVFCLKKKKIEDQLIQRITAAHVIIPERIATLDDDVALLYQYSQRSDGRLLDLAGTQHHPRGPHLVA